MKLKSGRRAAARIAVTTVTLGFAAVAVASPASAESWSNRITVDPCKQPQTQVCKNTPTWTEDLSSPTNVWVTADPTHCSDIVAHVFVDHREVGSRRLGPGESTHAYMVPPGQHAVGVRADGVSGGCNRGFLGAWGGTLNFRTVGRPIDGRNGE
jgi:hypothetical protein